MSKYAPHGGRSTNQARATSSTVCQKCLGRGHFTYECKGARPYVTRPSRTQQLENPRLLAKLRAEGKPSVEVPEEFKKVGTANKILEAKEKERSKEDKGKGKESSRKKAKRSRANSGSDSGSSDSDSDSSSSSSSSESDSSSDSDSSSGSDVSRSRERDRKRRVPKRRSSPSDSEASRGRKA
ncbi:zinc knuckle-domain-containing protein [Crassisporium funariophilum]|nr:zinc knuckle-domain-containing protein [Crassisporium funariophilum]